jgi:hypothetical protein
METLHDRQDPLDTYVLDWLSWVAPMFNMPVPMEPQRVVGDGASASAQGGHVARVLGIAALQDSSK